MSKVKVGEMTFGRLRAPDLDAMEEFLTGIGMVRADRTPTALYMCGVGRDHHIHVTEKAEKPRYVGMAFNLRSEDDLKAATSIPGASGIETIDEPGGGKRVRVTEPNGYQIELTYGVADVTPHPVRRQAINTALRPGERVNEILRLPNEPFHIKRIGHMVICTPKVVETVHWFRDNLGFIRSDDFYDGDDPENLTNSFNRVDCGAQHVDHHSVYMRKANGVGIAHIAFEVADIDDVFMGHDYLMAKGRFKHMWGPGRHREGSQIGDYWLDPVGNLYEFWTDMDRINADGPKQITAGKDRIRSNQWGPHAPQEFGLYFTP